MTDVIEKAAEAMALLLGPDKFDDLPKDERELRRRNRERTFGDALAFTKDDLIELAQAAYTAIVGDKVLVDREPTREMVRKGYKASLSATSVSSVRAIWTAMLNASEGG